MSSLTPITVPTESLRDVKKEVVRKRDYLPYEDNFLNKEYTITGALIIT